jgi:hypothetical protein
MTVRVQLVPALMPFQLRRRARQNASLARPSPPDLHRVADGKLTVTVVGAGGLLGFVVERALGRNKIVPGRFV